MRAAQSPARCPADAVRRAGRTRSAGRLTPPRSAVRAEPLFCRSYPSEVADCPEIKALQVAFPPLSGRTDAHTERVNTGEFVILIAVIIGKYIYNQMSRRGNQAKAWTQAAPGKGAHLDTLHRLRLFVKMVANS